MNEISAPSPGWAAIIAGHEFDIRIIMEELRPPFDPWTETYVTDTGAASTLLRSQLFAAADDGHRVFQLAVGLVQRLHGAMVLQSQDAEALVVQDVLKFDEVGRRVPILIALAGRMRISGGRVYAMVSRSPRDLAQASLSQRLLSQGKINEQFEDLLVSLSRSDNWYDLYKTIEIVENLFGGHHKTLARLGAEARQWRVVRETSNYYRHAVNVRLPEDPPALSDAITFVMITARKLLND